MTFYMDTPLFLWGELNLSLKLKFYALTQKGSWIPMK